MLQFSIETAIKAGEVLNKYFLADYKISTKSTDRDLVTQADLESERIILSAIKKRYPVHAVLSEEQGNIGTSDYLWLVDPLDGTSNFANKYPIFCIAIALAFRKEVILSVTFDPLRNEMFAAEKGKGATLNGRPIHVSKSQSLSSSLIATGFSYDRATNPKNNLVEFGKVMPLVRGIRRSGTAALDLAYVACGRLDGYWEYNLYPWDFVGGMLLVEEAGGQITEISRSPLRLESKSVIAGNSDVYQALHEVITG